MKHRRKRKMGRRNSHPTGPPLNCGEQKKESDCSAPEGGEAE